MATKWATSTSTESDLKSFFRDKEIDVSEVIEAIKVSKRKDDPKAYWQLYYLVFSAFYIEHS